MSKIGRLAMECQERAEELGFSTIEEALDAGYEVEYRTNGDHTLVRPDPQELAHREWERERNSLLTRLEKQRDTFEKLHYVEPQKLLEDTIEFIKQGEI